MANPDVLIIGSGIGGATLAAVLAASGRRIIIWSGASGRRYCSARRDDGAIFGAVLMRHLAQNFAPTRHTGGMTPGWPFACINLERHYQVTQEKDQVRGTGQ
jgi:hypothetical protein